MPPLRVLLVEDSEDDAALEIRHLQQGGYEVFFEQVETAVGMRDALNKQQWDIVLSDYSMPQFSAEQALAILKEHGSDLPFIIVSGTIGEETAVAALLAGARDFLVKGNLSRLIPSIERELNEAKERQKRKQAEKELRSVEDRFAKAFQANPAGISITTFAEGRFIDVNDSFLKILGYTREEIIGHTSHEYQFWETLEERQEAAMVMFDPTVPHDLEVKLRTKKGEVRHLLVAREIIDIAGEQCLLAMMHDITERKQAEDEVRKLNAQLERRVIERTTEFQQAKERVEAILNSSSDAVILTSVDGVVQQVNPSFVDMFGYSLDELFGRSIIILVVQDNVERVIDVLQHVVNTGNSKTVEVTVQRKDGSTFDGDLALAPIMEGSTIHGIVCSLRDITARKQAERALQSSEELYRALMNNASDPIVIVDTNGRIVLVNARTEEFIGYPQDELIGQPVEILLSDGFRERHVRHRMGYSANPFPRTIGENLNLIIRHKSGSEFPVKISLSPIQTGNEMLIMAYIIDITAEKQLEDGLRAALAKEKELNEMKSRFVSMASHEFRTPLATILAAADTLSAYRHKMDEDRITEKLTRIAQQVNHLTGIINDVLNLGRMQSTWAEFKPVVLRLDMLCQDIVDEFQSDLEARRQLLYTCQPVPLILKLDEKLMREIVTNLISNAVKYSPPDKSVLINLDYTGDLVVLRVQDQGIGIPKGDLEHLFEPFHRAANVGNVSGTGLGLSITKQAVELHGGTLRVESEVGAGTTFIVTIPFPSHLPIQELDELSN